MALKIARSIPEVPKKWQHPVGFVPTMGAFHEGHLELMRTAQRECGYCAISIFVNPTQFGPGEDFEKYPRDEERDLEMAESAGVDFAFVPTVASMYSSNKTSISIKGITDRWEGEHRPEHFDGVATVVAKLFNIIHPSHAYFGLKDFQQCAVIRQMADDLNFGLTLRFLETVREPDGLALSSRNRYLSKEERELAPQFYQALKEAASDLRHFREGTETVENTMSRYVERLESLGFSVDYFAIVDPITLEPLYKDLAGGRMIGAVKLGTTRLIDNCGV